MQIRLSDHFTYKRLLRFTLPSVVTMIIASVYSVVDGLFVSNLVGAMALSAINIAFPVAMIIGSVGFMLGTGGSALVAKTLGEGKKELANQYFSMLIYSMLIIGGILTALSLIFVRPIMQFAGASALLMEDCVIYGAILLAGSVPFMLQVSFQNFFVVNEKPILGLVLSIASGVTNMALDYVFIAVLKMGVAGAALALNGYGICSRWRHSTYLFCKKKRPWSSARENKILRKTASSGSIQWLFGTDEQYFRVIN